MGSAFWISSVVGGHHNLMLRRQQPGEHPIIDPAQESLLFRRIVAMGRFIRPVDMQQHKGAAFRRSQGCLCLGVQIRIHIASSPLYREKLHVQQPGNPLYQLLAADHGALLGKWRQCYRNRLSPQKHTSFFRQQSFKGMAQYQASLRAQCPLPAGRNLRYNVIHSMRHVGKYQQCLIAAQPVIGKCRILYLCRGTARHGTAALSIQRVAAAPQQQVIGPDGDSGPQSLYIASEMYRQIRYPQQAQYAVQCFRWEAAAGIHIPHRTHGRQMAISLHLKVGIRHAVNHA